MTDHSFQDNPIRSKTEMLHDIIKIIQSLHLGKPLEAESLIEDLKARSVNLDEEVQRLVLIFVEQIQFQYAYDPWHNITEEVRLAADQLIEHLGIHQVIEHKE